MSKKMTRLLMVLCCGALVAGGCAKKEMIKGEEGQTPSATAPVTPPPVAAPVQPKQPLKEEPIQQQPITDAAALKEQPVAKSVSEAEMGTVYFDFDAFTLSPAARETLTKNAQYMLSKNTGVKFQIEGHCDERGSDEYNLALGEKRATAVMHFLVTLGVPANRLSIISYGKEKPANPGHDEAAWAKNRRAEFVVQ
jgi:peptidoglycan-associated lipoprotein